MGRHAPDLVAFYLGSSVWEGSRPREGRSGERGVRSCDVGRTRPRVHGRQSVLPLRLQPEGIPQLLPLGTVTCRLHARGCFGWSLSSWREASHCPGVLGVTPPHWIQVSRSVSAQVCVGAFPKGIYELRAPPAYGCTVPHSCVGFC